MFCSNCGSKVGEKASFCSKCGASIEKNEESVDNPKYTYTKKVYAGNGLSIAGMVLGIIAIYFAIVCILMLFTDDFKTDMIRYAGSVAPYAFGFVLIPLVLSFVSMPLSICGRVKHKSGKNLSGIILSSLSLVVSIVVFIYIITTYS